MNLCIQQTYYSLGETIINICSNKVLTQFSLSLKFITDIHNNARYACSFYFADHYVAMDAIGRDSK